MAAFGTRAVHGDVFSKDKTVTRTINLNSVHEEVRFHTTINKIKRPL